LGRASDTTFGGGKIDSIVTTGSTTRSLTAVDMAFYTMPSGNTGTTEKMRITSGGSVGIGDTTPSQKLDVNGTVRADDFVEFSQPIPTEEAMPIIMGMKNKEDGTLDHKTFLNILKKKSSSTETKDEDGKVLEEAKTITKESVSLSAQVKYLIKAVQELNAKIETFK